jgi:DNA-directed RNA polymerase specialized sigma24 family protein
MYDCAVRKQLIAAIVRALEAFAPRDRAQFIGFYLHGLSLEELATGSKETKKAVRQRLYRMRNRLRLVLKQEGWWDKD